MNEKVAVLTQKVTELKERMDNFKPKKTVKKKAVGKAVGMNSAASSSAGDGDSNAIELSEGPSRPGACRLHGAPVMYSPLQLGLLVLYCC